MIALRDYQPQAQQQRGNGNSRPRQAAPPIGQRRASLIERMNGQYWRIAKRSRTLLNIAIIYRDDLVIYPSQCQATEAYLVDLRTAARKAGEFYSSLDPETMKRVAPWGTVVKLHDLDYQVSEVLLIVAMLEKATRQEPTYTRVQLHLLVRELLPKLITTFEDVTSQLAALVEKAQAGEEAQA